MDSIEARRKKNFENLAQRTREAQAAQARLVKALDPIEAKRQKMQAKLIQKRMREAAQAQANLQEALERSQSSVEGMEDLIELDERDLVLEDDQLTIPSDVGELDEIDLDDPDLDDVDLDDPDLDDVDLDDVDLDSDVGELVSDDEDLLDVDLDAIDLEDDAAFEQAPPAEPAPDEQTYGPEDLGSSVGWAAKHLEGDAPGADPAVSPHLVQAVKSLAAYLKETPGKTPDGRAARRAAEDLLDSLSKAQPSSELELAKLLATAGAALGMLALDRPR